MTSYRRRDDGTNVVNPVHQMCLREGVGCDDPACSSRAGEYGGDRAEQGAANGCWC